MFDLLLHACRGEHVQCNEWEIIPLGDTPKEFLVEDEADTQFEFLTGPLIT